MTIGFILIIIITRYLRRTQKEALSEKWHRVLKGLMIAAIVFIAIELPFKAAHKGTMWIAHGLLLYIVYILYKEKEFSGARQVLIAITPYVLVSFFNDIIAILNKNLYNSISGWLDTGAVFAVIWMIAMLFITNRQKKALEKEQQKLKQEEEQNRVMAQLDRKSVV